MDLQKLSDLLQLDLNGLHLEQATITTQDEKVIINGNTTVFGNENENIRIELLVNDDSIQNKIEIDYQSMTMKQIAETGFLPASYYQPSDYPSITFQDIHITSDKPNRTIIFTGTAQPENLTLGVQTLPLVSLQIVSKIYIPESDSKIVLEAFMSGVLQIGEGLKIRVEFPTQISDWQINSEHGVNSDLDNGISGLTPVTGENLVALLPVGLANLSNFSLKEFGAQYSTGTEPVIRNLSLTISNANPWPIVEPNVLTITKMQVALNLLFVNRNTTLTGSILGEVLIYETIISAQIPIPPASGNWTLRAYPQFSIPGIGDMASQLSSWLGAVDFSECLPPEIYSFGNLSFDFVEVQFDPNMTTIAEVQIRLSSQEPWGLPYIDNVKVDNILIELTVVNPLTDAEHRQITGVIGGALVIGETFLPISIARPTGEDSWSLKVTTENLSLGVKNIVALMGIEEETFRNALPSELSIISDLVISDFSILYDLSDQSLIQSSIRFSLEKNWTLIENYLAVNQIEIFVQYERAYFDDSGNPLNIPEGVVTAALGMQVQIVDVRFNLSAANTGASQDWTFGAMMEEGDTISLSALLDSLRNKLIPNDFSTPKNVAFPADFEVTAAEVEVTPAIGKFRGYLQSAITWPLPFAGAVLNIKNLNTIIEGQRDQNDSLIYRFTADGSLEFNGIYAQVEFSTGNDESDTILLGEVTNQPSEDNLDPHSGVPLSPAAKALNLNLPGIANGLKSGEENQETNWNTLIPNVPVGFSTFGLISAELAINISKDVFMLYGESSKFGKAALLLTKKEDDWQYLVAVALAEDFTFASIWSELSSVDSVLKVRKASFAIADFTSDSALKTINNLPNKSVDNSPSPQAKLLEIIQLKTSGEEHSEGQEIVDTNAQQNLVAIGQGVNFYGELIFPGLHHGDSENETTSSSILNNVPRVLPDVADSADLSIYGYINNAEPTKTVFKAWLGKFRIFNILEFSKIYLAYYPNNANELQLNGRITAQLNENTQFLFDGAMLINNQKALFNGELFFTATADLPNPPTLNAPLGMFGITLKDLKFRVEHFFGDNPPPTVISLVGEIWFGKVIDGNPQVALNGQIYWVDDTPILAEIELTKELGLISFFTTVFTNGLFYSPDAPDIVLKEGRIYYLKSLEQQVILGKTYLPDFNLFAKVELFGVAVTLNAQVWKEHTLPGFTKKQSGIVVTGSFDEPISLWFMGFYDSTFSTSPALLLEVLTSRKAFGLDIGLKFFDEEFAKGRVTVGKTAGTKDAQILTELTYLGPIKILKYSKLVFTYSQSEGFNLKKLPFHSEIALDLVKLRKAVSALRSNGCEQLIDQGFKQLIKTNFLIQPHMSEQQDNSLHVTLTGIYTLSLIDNNHPFLFVEMPQITLTISLDDQLTLSRLPVYFIEQVAANTGPIIEQLLSQPVKLSTLISAIVAQNAIKGIVSDLVCDMESVEESAEATEAAEEAAEAAEEAAEALEAAEEAGATAEEIAELAAVAAEAAEAAMAAAAAADAGAASAAAVAAGAAAVAAVGIGGIIAGFIGAIFGGSGENSGGSNTGEDNQGVPPQERPHKLSKVTNIKFPPVNANTLRVTWGEVDNAGWYQVTVIGNSLNIKQTTGGQQFDFSASTLPVGQYSVEVIAFSTNFPASTVAVSDSFWKTAPPTLKQLSLSENIISAEIDQAAAGANSYQVELIMNDEVIGPPKSMSGSPVQAQFTITDLTAKYQVRVSSLVTQGIPSGWQISPNVIKALIAPLNISFSYDDINTRFTVDWTEVSGSNGYRIRIVNKTDHSNIVTSVDVDKNKVSEFISLAGLTIASGSYIAQVQAISGANKLTGLFGSSTDTVTKLETPDNINLGYENIKTRFNVTWDAATGNNGYTVRIVNRIDPTQIVAMEVVESEQQSKFISLEQFSGEGGDFIAEVMAKARDGNLPSEFGQSASSVKQISVSKKVNCTFDQPSAELVITWESVDDNQGYEIEMYDIAKPEQFVFQGDVAIDLSTFRVSYYAISSVVSQSIKTRVRAKGIATDPPGIFADSIETIQPQTPPTNIRIENDVINKKVMVNWDADSDNSETGGGYDVRIINMQDPTTALKTVTTTRQVTTAEFTRVDFPEGFPPHFQASVSTKGDTLLFNSDFGLSINTLNQLFVRESVRLIDNQSDNLLTVSWTVTMHNDGFVIELFDPATPETVVKSVELAKIQWDDSGESLTTRTNIQYEDLPSDTSTFQARVQARGKDDYFISPFVNSKEIVTKLAAPVMRPLVVEGQTLIASLNTTENEGKSYQAQLVVDGAPVGTINLLTESSDLPKVLQSVFTIDDTLLGTQFSVQMRTINYEQLASRWAVSAETITRLSGPVSLRYVEQKFAISWQYQSVEISDAYQVELLDKDALPIIPQPSITYVDGGAEIDINNLTKGLTYRARVRGKLNGRVNGLWSIASNQITFIPAQQSLIKEVSYNKSVFPTDTATPEQAALPYSVSIDFEASYVISQVVVISDWWTKRPKKITLFDNEEKQIGQGLFPTYNDMLCGENGNEKCDYPDNQTSLMRIYLDDPKPQSLISVQIDDHLPSVDFVALIAIRLHGDLAHKTQLSEVRLKSDLDKLTITWKDQSVESSDSYEVQLLDKDELVVNPQPVINYVQNGAEISIDNLTKGFTYRARVRGILNGQILGLWSTISEPVTFIPVQQPLIKELTYNKELFSAETESPEQAVLPYIVSIDLEATFAVSQVVLVSDWWVKRPKKITLFDSETKQIGQGFFPTYNDMLCGENGDQKCYFPNNQTSLMRVYLDESATLSTFSVQIEGLLSSEEYATLIAIRVHGDLLHKTSFSDIQMKSEQNKLKISWQDQSEIKSDSYEVQLLDKDEAVVSPQPPMTYVENGAEIDITNLTQGPSYRARVRGILTGQVIGLWSAASSTVTVSPTKKFNQTILLSSTGSFHDFAISEIAKEWSFNLIYGGIVDDLSLLMDNENRQIIQRGDNQIKGTARKLTLKWLIKENQGAKIMANPYNNSNSRDGLPLKDIPSSNDYSVIFDDNQTPTNWELEIQVTPLNDQIPTVSVFINGSRNAAVKMNDVQSFRLSGNSIGLAVQHNNNPVRIEYNLRVL